jgi:hypothetical protein
VARRIPGIALIFLAGASIVAPASRSSAAAPPARVVVLTLDGTSIQDWEASPELSTFVAARATGLLATRTHSASPDPGLLRASAYATLGAGAAAEIRNPRRPTEAGRGVLAGALGEALARRGLQATAIGDGSGAGDGADAPAGLAAMRADGLIAVDSGSRLPLGYARRVWLRSDPAAPGGYTTDYVELERSLQAALDWASVVVVDLGDTWRADRAFANAPGARAPWLRRALRDAAGFAGDVVASLRSSDTLIVASIVPPLARVRGGKHLGAIAMSGHGLITGETTRRAGVVSLTDLGPTILARLSVPVPSEMQGRLVHAVPSTHAVETAAGLDRAFVRAMASRRPLTRVWLIGAAVLAAAAFLTVVAGRGKAPGRERVTIRWRDIVATALIAIAAAPATALVAPAMPGSSVTALVAWTFALAAATALLARALLGHARALLAVSLLVTVLFAADLLAGSPLAARSGIGFQVAGGGRFYGIDEGLLGVMLAGPLVAAGLAIDRARRAERARGWSVAMLVATAALASAPWWGSKFGAPFTLVPAFGVFVVLARGHRIARTSAIGIAIATVLVSASFTAADALRAPAVRSHIGREITGATPVGALVTRKLSGLVHITLTTVWLPVALVIAGSAAAIMRRRSNLTARALWGRPGTRAALWAIAAGSVFALGSNDTGIMTAAAALAIGAAAFYEPFLVPEDSPPRR